MRLALADGPLGPIALAARTGISARTLRYAISRLRASGEVGARVDPRDGRRIEFFLRAARPPPDRT